MKRIPIYLLLFFYTAVQLKPLAAVVQDILAHTFFKVQHMATIHYENGHYHLHKELKSINEAEQTSSSQKIPSEKTNENSSPQQITELNFNFNTSVTNASPLSSTEPELLEGHILKTFRPPSQA